MSNNRFKSIFDQTIAGIIAAVIASIIIGYFTFKPSLNPETDTKTAIAIEPAKTKDTSIGNSNSVNYKVSEPTGKHEISKKMDENVSTPPQESGIEENPSTKPQEIDVNDCESNNFGDLCFTNQSGEYVSVYIELNGTPTIYSTNPDMNVRIQNGESKYYYHLKPGVYGYMYSSRESGVKGTAQVLVTKCQTTRETLR